jgi:hypothetical protein
MKYSLVSTYLKESKNLRKFHFWLWYFGGEAEVADDGRQHVPVVVGPDENILEKGSNIF